MEKEYNILNDIDNFKNDIIQLLDNINLINDRLKELNDLLIKHINNVCNNLSYVDNLICFDQLSNKFDIEYTLRKNKIFYSYVVINDKYISYNYFTFKNGIFSNTFDRSSVDSGYLKKDLETLNHILVCINDVIDTIK